MLTFRWPILLEAGLLALAAAWGTASAELVITEVVSCSTSSAFSEVEGTPDWIELTCLGTEPVALEDHCLRRGGRQEPAVSLPPGSLSPGERVVFLATGRESPEAGARELPFRLKAAGDRLELSGPSRQQVEIPALLADVAYDPLRGTFLATPTPGRPNADAVGAPLEPPAFSHARGFYEGGFRLALRSGDDHPGAEIRFTTDGTMPSARNGVPYLGPLPIVKSTVLRAVALRPGHLPSPVATATYLFPQQVVVPSREVPTGWPEKSFINKQKLVLAQWPGLVVGASESELFAGLRSLPSISLVMDLNDLLDPHRGIYVNALERGMAWERPISLEWIPSEAETRRGGRSFQANVGLRIRGGASRRGRAPKHGFRVVARERYGEGILAWPFFGEDGPRTCHGVDLRTPQDHSWASNGSPHNTFLRDVFCRDTQRDLGWPHTAGRAVHLFLNGVYWGICQTVERVDAEFAAVHAGGDPEDYDVVKVGRFAILDTHVAARDGDLQAWRHFWETVNRLAATRDAGERLRFYHGLRGCDAAGRPDPGQAVILDVDALIDYMMIILFRETVMLPSRPFWRTRGLTTGLPCVTGRATGAFSLWCTTVNTVWACPRDSRTIGWGRSREGRGLRTATRSGFISSSWRWGPIGMPLRIEPRLC